MIVRQPPFPSSAAWILLAVGVAVAIAPCQAASPRHLGDLGTWTVVVGRNALPSERYAAEEFVRLFKLATDASLPISEAPGTTGSIHIGQGAVAPNEDSPDISTAGEEGLRLRIHPGAIFVTGGRPRGSLYGVYEFFERYAGVRFLTADHTYVPAEARNAVLPVEDFSYDPPFSFRSSYYRENYAAPAFATRLRVNTITDDPRLGGKTSQQLISHSLQQYLPVATYGRDHPEYFALIGGTRRLEGQGGGPQVCSLNRDVIRLVTEAVLRELDAHPAWTNISVSPPDNDACCECRDCSALIAREGTLGAPHLVLVNAVAAAVAKSHPGVRVGTLIYWHTRKPPMTLNLEPNVEIQLCSIEACNLHPLADSACFQNRVFMQDFTQWQEICRHVWLWNYNVAFRNYDLPFTNLEATGPNLSLFRDRGVHGVFMQAAGDGMSAAYSDLHNYVIARCLWRPVPDSWPLVEEFCRLHYGPAAAPILDGLRYLYANAHARGVYLRCMADVPIELGLDAAVARGFHDRVAGAEHLADDDTLRGRVEKAMIPVLGSLLATAPRTCTNGSYRLDVSSLPPGSLQRYIELARKHGMTLVGEGRDAAAHFLELESLEKGWPVITLENAVWRLVVSTMADGRIMLLNHKPTGRQIIAPPSTRMMRWAQWNLWPESARVGVNSLAAGTRSWTSDPRKAVMTLSLPDGNSWKRTISLEDSGAIQIQMELKAAHSLPAWTVRERSAEYAVSSSDSPFLTAVYLRDPAWRQVNANWDFGRMNVMQFHVPGSDAVRSLAFFDRTTRFGITHDFHPGTFTRFAASWNPGREFLGLDYWVSVPPLQPGKTFSFSYDLRPLAAPPANASSADENPGH
ncbi:MAG: DUF4838 domain-containing protein [Opitutaceae bacterium]|nr:DUF4838 domain-containing protein [Opitutaceae bacterium]